MVFCASIYNKRFDVSPFYFIMFTLKLFFFNSLKLLDSLTFLHRHWLTVPPEKGKLIFRNLVCLYCDKSDIGFAGYLQWFYRFE